VCVKCGCATKAPKSADATGPKNKITAALLAFFLGGFGAHKFYLGHTGIGIFLLLINTVGLLPMMFLLFIPNLILGVITLIEAILYLTKSDEEFDRVYVQEKRRWF
jgi:TM2 domain-containing membrane protein YozV